MANHTVLIPTKIVAKDVDAYVRPAKCGSDVDNGMVMTLSGKSTVSGESEVWTTAVPTTGSLNSLWMALEPEMPFGLAGTNVYNGLGTVQNFYSSASTVFTAYKPQKGDLITVTAEAFVSGTAPTAGQFAYSVNASWLLTAGTWPGDNVTCYKFSGSSTIPSADGTIGSGRITAYTLECIAN